MGGDGDLYGMIQDESRHLRCQLVLVVLLEAIEKDGAVLPNGAVGDQIRKVVGIMDGPICKALELGAAPVKLELWWVHTELGCAFLRNS